MTTDRICRNCRHATTEPGHREHYRLGLRNCEHKPNHHFVTGHHTCSKWAQKTKE